MALTDEYSFTATAGRGGDGVVRWRREKFRPKGGPCGGDGGTGGSLYIEGVRDVMILNRISHKTSYQAQHGQPGGTNSKHGADGDDLVIALPIGSVVTNQDTKETYELLAEHERTLVLRGGTGGYGNEHFKSSTNQQPQQATKGKPGETGHFSVELRLIADVGLVGLPNAGKTSLLNALTNAGARVGDYPFTTLDPNLGVYQGYVLADIPGLIEGASDGKGLGHKFLRHISRTSMLLHCISLEREEIVSNYNVVLQELQSYPGLAEKPQFVVLTKTDSTTQATIDHAKQEIESIGGSVLASVTILDDDSIRELADALTARLRASQAS
jgi:GTP-binding protein